MARSARVISTGDAGGEDQGEGQVVDGASHYDAGNPEPRVIPARDANACERARGAAHLNARDDLSGELRGTRGEPPFLF